MKRQRLRIASSVGWLAEFPADLWGVIISYLPEQEKGVPDLALMIRLMSVSKTMCQLLKAATIALCRDVLAYSSKRKEMGKGRDRFLSRLVLFITEVNANGELGLYINQCIENKAYQTPEHLSNCLSLFHYAVEEAIHLHPYTWLYGSLKYTYTPLTKPTMNHSLLELLYYRPSTKKAVTLYRMYNEVGILKDYTDSGIPLCMRAKELLAQRGDDARLIKLQTLTADGDKLAELSMIVAILTEEAPIETARIRSGDYFDDLVVKINGRQHYIYSEEARGFRERCFVDNGHGVASAGKAYLLDSLRVRNWAIITESDRFKVPST